VDISAEEIPSKLAELALALPDVLETAAGQISADAGDEQLYAVCLRAGSGFTSLSLVGNTVEQVDRYHAEFGDPRWGGVLSMDEWSLDAWEPFVEFHKRFRTLIESLDVAGGFRYVAKELWIEVVFDVLRQNDLRSMVTTSYKGDLLSGLAAHDIEEHLPTMVKFSAELNTPEWHEQIVGYNTWFESDEFPPELVSIV